MLQKLSDPTLEILEHADFLEGLSDDQFSMSSWGTMQEPRCICGWYCYRKGHFRVGGGSGMEYAREKFGLTPEQANKLFSNQIDYYGPKEAARTLRHLAITGEII